MIRINLLKGSAFQLEKPKRARSAKGGRRLGIIIAAILAFLGTAGGLGYFFLKPAPAPKVVETRVAQPPSSAALRGIEETVKDVSEAKAVINSKGFLLLPFEEMTQNEKLLYGSMFLRRAFSSVNRHADRTVDFNTMRIEQFTSFYILGIAKTKDDFTSFRKRLSTEPACSGLEVLSLKPAGFAPGKYRFELKGKLQFGLDYETLIQSDPLGRIPGHSEFQNLARRMREVGEPGIEWSKWNPLIMQPEGNYHRHAIEMEGVTTYRFCVEYLNHRLPELNSMVAFPQFSVKAIGKGKIQFEAVAYFYTRSD